MTDARTIRPAADAAVEGPQSRLIAECSDWSVSEYVCTAGPGERSFEERHETFTIAAVVQGTFRYETSTGRALLHPGCWLLGNHNECFACGHEHSRGDRCVSLHVSPHYFAEVAASRGGSGDFRFVSPFMPATVPELSLLAHACSLAGGLERIEMDEVVTAIVEKVIGQQAGAHSTRPAVSARDEKRISAVLHHLEDHYAETLDLDGLAKLALMSKYHFLRTFHAVVGCSPYQYLISFRLQRSAHYLINSADAIAHIAQGCGFGDLSTFGSHFKQKFGQSPSAFRMRYSRIAGKRAAVLNSKHSKHEVRG